MNDRQRAILVKGFVLLRNGARRGEELAKNGTMTEVLRHVEELIQMGVEMQKAIALAAGADVVLKVVDARKKRTG